MSRDDRSSLDDLVGVVAVGTLPIGILSFLFVGSTAGITVFVLGWFLLVPLLGILSDRLDDSRKEVEYGRSRSSATDRRDPLETLRERYARGEIDEEEFERRLEDVLETDPNESASRLRERARSRELERE